MDLNYTFGLNDYKDFTLYRDKTDPGSKAWKGRYYLWNNDLINAKKNFDEAKKSPDLEVNIKPEIANLLSLTTELTAPYIGVSYSLSDILLKQEVVGFTDVNGDGYKQSWEKYNYVNNRPDYKLMDVAQKREELLLSYKDPSFPIIWGLQGSLGVNIKQADYQGTLDTRFRFYPYVDPAHPEYTPDHLMKLNGSEYTACKFGPVESQDASLNVSLPMFGVWQDLPVFSQLFSKPSVGYKNTLTEVGITAFPDYKYNEINENIGSEGKNGTFTSDRHDLTFGLESRTFPVFDWPYSVYPALTFEYKQSWLSKNMPDMYYLSDQNYVPPTYDKDVKLTDAQRDKIKSDYYDNYMQSRGANDVLTANEVILGFRLNIPGVAQLLRDTGIVDKTGFDMGSDNPIKTSSRLTWTNNDYIRNTDNGLYPAYRNLFGEWHLDGLGNLVKVGSDLNEKMEPYNGSSWNISVDHKLRLGHLCRVMSAWDKGYFDKYDLLSLRTLWLIPSLIWPVVRAPISLLDDGFDRSTPIYMPIEFSFGGGNYTVGGETKTSSESSFSIGIGIRDDLILKYRTFKSDNGYNYSESGQNLSLTWLFY